MKRYIDLPLFTQRLRQGLIEKQLRFSELPRFKGILFDVCSGADLAYVWFEYFREPIDPDTVRVWLRGKGLPSPTHLRMLAELLGQPISWLCVFKGESTEQTRQPEAAVTLAAYGDPSSKSQIFNALGDFEVSSGKLAVAIRKFFNDTSDS